MFINFYFKTLSFFISTDYVKIDVVHNKNGI